MDTFLVIFAILLCLIGLIGSIIPGLPGPPLNYVGMIIIQWVSSPFKTSTIVIFAILIAIVIVIDYLLPVWFAKRFGATKQGIWGSIIGMLLGMFLTPIGMVLGMLIGAIAGDIIAGRTSTQATKSGVATFFGTLLTFGIKLVVAAIITGMVFYESYRFFRYS